MQIGELAKKAGVSVRAVRYYEELGLISPESHSQGGFRLYGDGDLKRLGVINFLKEVGLSLGEIRRILSARESSAGSRELVEFLFGAFREKLGLVETKLAALGRMKAELVQALEILESCKDCDRSALLDAIACASCTKMSEDVPATLDVILH
jgi:DNA-binding transcriptional MerR regulator